MADEMLLPMVSSSYYNTTLLLAIAKIDESAVAHKVVDLRGRNQMFRELIEANSLLLGGFNLEDFFPGLARLGVVRRLLCAKAHDVNKRWDKLLDKLIDDHASKRSSSSVVEQDDDEESDFIHHEYGLTRDNVKAILVIMFEGGTDTSYIELEYAMAELMRKPQLMAKLQAEVRSVVPRGQEIVTEEQLVNMPYLKAVIKETLQLHLVGPLLVPHLSIVDCVVEGYTIPLGTRVFVNAWALCIDPNFWENAEEFMPKRFLNGMAPDYKGNEFHFLPFGTGRRICPGINFATATIEIMLANLVYRFDWEIPADQVAKGGIDMTETFGLTVHRKEKVLLVPRIPQKLNSQSISIKIAVLIFVFRRKGKQGRTACNAEEFTPVRFLNDTAPDYKKNEFHFLPFGTGRRICPDINFAMATIEIMLRNLVYHFDWKIPADQVAKGDIDMAETFWLTVHREEKSSSLEHINNKLEEKKASSIHNLPPSPPKLPLIGHIHLVGTNPHISLSNLAKNHSGDGLLLLQLSTALLLALLCPLLLLLIKRHCWPKTSREMVLLDKLPSPPWRLPVIGHLHLVGTLPYVSFRDLAAKHGPHIMLLHLGAVPTLVVSSARAAMAVLRTNDHVFASRAYSAVTDILYYGSSDIVFSPYGDYWRQVKKIATTHLLTSNKVRSYAAARQHEACNGQDRRGSGGTKGSKFFREQGRNQMFRELIEANSLLLGGFNLEDFFPGLARLGVVRRLLCAKAHDANRRWDKLLDELVDDHAIKRSSSSVPVVEQDVDEESDFIHVLLSIQHEYGLTRDNVKAILMIMFEGGTDTSYIELEYAMAELMRKPQLMAKLQAEVRSVVPRGQEIVTEEQLVNMPYLKAVIKETLRLHLPGPLLVPHLSIADCVIEGYTIPSSTRVFINAWALCRDPSFCENAEEFMPKRFLSDMAPDYKGNDFHFLPFGTGRRICPGLNFAIATIEIMLANLVYRFDWEIPANQVAKGGIDMTEPFGITVHRKEKLLLLPTPPGRLPVIGHLHLIGSLPHISLRDLANKHGPDLMLLYLGAVPTLVVSSSRAAQAVLRSNDRVFASRPYSTVANILFYGATDVVFSPYNEHWRNIKKIATTHLLSMKKVRSYGLARQCEVQLVVARIAMVASTHAVVDLTELLSCYSNNILCHALSGKEEGQNQLFRELVEANSSLLGGFNIEDYFPSLTRLAAVRRLLCAKSHDINRRWDQLLEKLIDDHTNRHRFSSVLSHDDEEHDFKDVLLSIQHEYGLTRDHIKANLVVMFEAGTDTSFIELEYAMAELMKKPQVMAKLQAEVRSVVQAVIKETLRLHPAGPLLVPHLSMAACNVKGYIIPSSTRIVINAWALARDPIYWENADEFLPERFISNTIDYNRNDFHFLPFGSGRRICLGINFAMAAIEIMLANLVYRFNWEVLADQAMKGGIDMTEKFGVSVHRKEKLLLVPHLP
uniref:Uncharacterized protein n=1 Tax=Leersia perrieri TaxID=77586 RepID=A0A0D9X3H9_9ORYZ